MVNHGCTFQLKWLLTLMPTYSCMRELYDTFGELHEGLNKKTGSYPWDLKWYSAVGGDAAEGSGMEACSAGKNFHLHFWVIRMGSHTFVLWRLGSMHHFQTIWSHRSLALSNVATWLPTGLLGVPLKLWILAEMWLLPWNVIGLKPGP